MKKICVICGKEYETEYKNKICCSDVCKTKRAKEVAKKYREEHKEEIREYQRAYSKIRYAAEFGPIQNKSAQVVEIQKYTNNNNDPKWVEDYFKGNRLTQIAMLSKALLDLQIANITYGKLTMLYRTEQYNLWEEQVIALKRNEYVKAKNSITS